MTLVLRLTCIGCGYFRRCTIVSGMALCERCAAKEAT